MASGYKVLLVGDTTDAAWVETAKYFAKINWPNDAYWLESGIPAEGLAETCTDAVTDADNPCQAALDGEGLGVCSAEMVDGLVDVVVYGA